jgi:hypothetical protein
MAVPDTLHVIRFLNKAILMPPQGPDRFWGPGSLIIFIGYQGLFPWGQAAGA